MLPHEGVHAESGQAWRCCQPRHHLCRALQDMLLLEQHRLLTRAAAQLPAFSDMVLLLKARKASRGFPSSDIQESGFHHAPEP